jgi:hypothetical protein
MPIRYRNGKPLLTHSLRYVLANRPTRVIVGGHPGDSADGSRASVAPAPARA